MCERWIKRERQRGRVGQDRVGVEIGGFAARSSCVASLCVVCSGECVLFCPFRSHGRAGAYF